MSPKLCWQPQKKKIQSNQNIYKAWKHKWNDNTRKTTQTLLYKSKFKLQTLGFYS